MKKNIERLNRIFSMIILFFFSTTCSCSNSVILEPINIDKTLIEPFLRNEYLNPENKEFSFDLIEKVNYDFNADGNIDTLLIFKLKDWGDPGDYHKVVIKGCGDNVEFVNYEGWNKFDSDNNILNSRYLTLIESSKNRLLLLNGYVYGSGPGLSTIIDVVREKPEIVYNKKVFFDDIEINESEINIKCKTNDEYFKLRIFDNRFLIKN